MSRFIVEELKVAQITSNSLPYEIERYLDLVSEQAFIDKLENDEKIYNGTVFQKLLDNNLISQKFIPILKELVKDCENYDYVMIIK